MTGKMIALSMGLGAAAGAVAIMMLPQQNAARRWAKRTAAEVEDVVASTADKITQMGDKMLH